MTRKSYQKYKDSGIEWLGKIPEHWEVMPFKYNYRFSMGQTILANDLEDDGDIPVISATEEDHYFGHISNPQFILKKDDFVIPARGISIGAVKKVIESSVCTQTTIYAKKYITQNLESNFIFFYQIGYRKHLFQYDRTAIPQITVEQVKNNPILLPPLSEQKAIADFLDKETSRIDSLVQKKEQQIELLKEKRSVLITQAVTKGLNRSVKMKDSGIEWLGKIPEHWDILKLKHGFRYIGSGTTPKSNTFEYYEGNTAWVTTSELRETLIKDTVNKLSKKALHDYSTLRLYPINTLLFAMYGATIGRLGILGRPATVNQACVAFSNPITLCTKFVYYWLWIRRPILIAISKGGGQPNLNQDELKQLKIPTPSLEEQKAIADFLDKETSRLDSLIEKIKKSIDLLKEYRLALITSAVTGQIDVRESQTQKLQKVKGEK